MVIIHTTLRKANRRAGRFPSQRLAVAHVFKEGRRRWGEEEEEVVEAKSGTDSSWASQSILSQLSGRIRKLLLTFLLQRLSL